MPNQPQNRMTTFLVIIGFLTTLANAVTVYALVKRGAGYTEMALVVSVASTFVVGVIALAKMQANRRDAEARSADVRQEIKEGRKEIQEVKQTAEAGTADKVADEVRKTIAQQLLADHDFVEPLAKKVAEIIKPEISGIADDAARKALKLYVDSQSAPGRVQT